MMAWTRVSTPRSGLASPLCVDCTAQLPRGCYSRTTEHALQRSSGVRTLFTQAEDQAAAEQPTWSSDLHISVFDSVTPWPNGVEDSAVTAPFVRALELEGPTSIFDRSPERANSDAVLTVRASRIDRAVTEEELDDSYEAALKKFV